MPDVDAMLTMSPDCWAFIIGTTRLVRSMAPKTFVANSSRIRSTSTSPISALYGNAALLTRMFDPAHPFATGVDHASVVGHHRDIGTETNGPRPLRDGGDPLLVSPGKDHRIPCVAHEADERSTYPLTPTRNKNSVH